MTKKGLLMKYMLLSDIHGSETTLQKALEQFHLMKCDFLCILGDILNYGPRNPLPEGLNAKGVVELLNPLADKIIAIRGNCDSEVDQMLLDFPCMADYALIIDEGKRLFLTHGHVYNESHLPKGKIDFLFCGHTHIWKLEQKENYILCNTGSITLPKQNNPATFAVYENGKIEMFLLNGEKIN